MMWFYFLNTFIFKRNSTQKKLNEGKSHNLWDFCILNSTQTYYSHISIGWRSSVFLYMIRRLLLHMVIGIASPCYHRDYSQHQRKVGSIRFSTEMLIRNDRRRICWSGNSEQRELWVTKRSKFIHSFYFQ